MAKTSWFVQGNELGVDANLLPVDADLLGDIRHLRHQGVVVGHVDGYGEAAVGPAGLFQQLLRAFNVMRVVPTARGSRRRRQARGRAPIRP